MTKKATKKILRNVNGGKLRSCDVSACYPGTRNLRFRAALAGARLSRLMRSRLGDADFVASTFRLDRIDMSSDCAEATARDLAVAANRALAAVEAFRAARDEWFAHMAKHLEAAHQTYPTARVQT